MKAKTKKYLQSCLINVDTLIDTMQGERTLGFILEHYASEQLKAENPRDILSEIIKLCDCQIPYWAYGDNEAACEMAQRLKKIGTIISQYIESNTKSGDNE